MLTAQWTRKLPIIQTTAPAELAARLIHTFLDDFPDIESEQYFVIDFCSGAGGKKLSFSLGKICDEVDSGNGVHDLCAHLQEKHQAIAQPKHTSCIGTDKLPSESII